MSGSFLMATLFVSVLLTGSVVAAGEVPAPRTGVFLTPADIERARQRAQEDEWARGQRGRILELAGPWLQREDEWIRQIMPPAGSRFAYGVAGCPECGRGWGRFGVPVADLDRPLVLKCPHCEIEIDLDDPADTYADDGAGVEVNGRHFWLRGVWNAFVVHSMWAGFGPEGAAVVTLADAYALTGDERYAKKAMVIMDSLATLAPTTIGPRDFENDPNREAGRLHHLTSIVYRAQVHFARALDIIGNHPGLHEPSPTNPGLSIWDNIRAGIFEDYLFKHFDPREANLRTLHNHEADSVRSMLLVGLMYGEPDYVRWSAIALQAFLDNTIDRDGLYYETSLGYANFARGVFLDMAEQLVRYDPADYPEEAGMPAREELPYAGNFYNHPGLARLALEVRPRLSVAGREPTFGNSGFDGRVWQQPGRPFENIEFLQAQRFVKYATNPHWHERAARLAAGLRPHGEGSRAGGQWRLYHSLDSDEIIEAVSRYADPAKVQAAGIPVHDESDLFGQAGLMYLRSGEGSDRRGLVMRVGPNLPHSHDDQMALMLFARGRAQSADIGYGIFGNHVHLGWAGRAIAHHTVVVNQDRTSNDRLFRMGPGGTIHRFFGDSEAGVAWAEASLTQMFPPEDGVRDYRRMVLQIDLSPESFYWVDLFDIDGGRVHDYSMHSNPPGEHGTFEISGVAPAAVEGVWTLAGLDPRWRDASFNQQGRSWGERLTVNGMIAPIAGAEDEVEQRRGWYPPPGNGYAFLHDVKVADSADMWQATWRWDNPGDPHGLRITMLPEHSQQVIAATGPNINGTQMMQFVIARSGEPDGAEDVRTRYAAVLEGFGEAPAVKSAEPVRQDGRIVGVRVRSGDREDLVLDARQAAITSPDVPKLNGGVGIVRRLDGELAALVLSGGDALEADGIGLRFGRGRLVGRIVAVDDEAVSFRVDPPLPAAALGSVITINNGAYSQGSAYRIGAIDSSGDIRPANAEMILQRARVQEVVDGGFVSSAPMAFGYLYTTDSRLLHGKRIASGGQSGRITAMAGFKDVRISGLSPRAGEEFVIYDVQEGDEVALDATATLRRDEGGEWLLRANAPVTVEFPWPVQRHADGRWIDEAGAVELDDATVAAGEVRFRKRP